MHHFNHCCFRNNANTFSLYFSHVQLFQNCLKIWKKKNIPRIFFFRDKPINYFSGFLSYSLRGLRKAKRMPKKWFHRLRWRSLLKTNAIYSSYFINKATSTEWMKIYIFFIFWLPNRILFRFPDSTVDSYQINSISSSEIPRWIRSSINENWRQKHYENIINNFKKKIKEIRNFVWFY